MQSKGPLFSRDGHDRATRDGSARPFTYAIYALFFLTVFLLLFCAYSVFTHRKWPMFDYGVYTNMVWNCGHGDWFRCLVDRNYLKTHLSFSLALLGPLFLVWDSPLLLIVAQWVAFCGGCLCIYRACCQYKLPRVATAAILCFFALWPFTQSVLLSEFHGVSMYLLLIPWLYVTCAFHRRWVALPLLLLMGLREDAFIYALPILLYFAVKDRWKAGYLYTALAIAYGLAALFMIYPWINDISLFQRRAREINTQSVFGAFTPEGLRLRAWGLLWVALPFLLLIRRGIGRAVLLAVVPVVFTIASGFGRQYELRNHYPAVVMAGMIIGLVEAVGAHGWTERDSWWRKPAVFAALLVALTLGAHLANGFLYFGRQYERRSGWPHGTGRLILAAVKQIPKEGLLVVPFHISGACANRADILSWHEYDPAKYDMQLAFGRLGDFLGGQGKKYRDLLNGGAFGVRYFDGRYAVLQKGWSTARNDELREAVDRAARTIPLVRTLMDAGDNRSDQKEGVRYWRPGRRKPPVTIVYGKGMPLAAGRYRAIFGFRSEPPPADRGDWGQFDLFELGGTTPIARAPIASSESRDYREQALEFTIDAPATIEPRITGGWAALWLLGVEFVLLPDAPLDVRP